MSAHLALPATTYVLQRLIEQQRDKAYGASLPNRPAVIVGPPPRLPVPTAGQAAPPEAPGIVLYLHHVGINAGWRNMLDPSVDANGQTLRHPPLVLDLHYMVASLGQGLEREALLGIALTALHRNPIVSRAKIAALIGANTVPQNPQTIIDLLPGEKLADPASQPESLAISQHALDVDLSTKLWSALQSPIRPCAYFTVTARFLTSDAPLPDGPETETVNLGVDVFTPDFPAGEDGVLPITVPVP